MNHEHICVMHTVNPSGWLTLMQCTRGNNSLYPRMFQIPLFKIWPKPATNSLMIFTYIITDTYSQVLFGWPIFSGITMNSLCQSLKENVWELLRQYFLHARPFLWPNHECQKYSKMTVYAQISYITNTVIMNCNIIKCNKKGNIIIVTIISAKYSKLYIHIQHTPDKLDSSAGEALERDESWGQTQKCTTSVNTDAQ